MWFGINVVGKKPIVFIDDKEGVKLGEALQRSQTLFNLFNQIESIQILAKVPVFKCQKMVLWTPQSKKGLQNPCETPPKMVD